MKAVFIELPAFERHRADYLDDAAYQAFQQDLMRNPWVGDVMRGCGGLRKVRVADGRRGKGKRGGIRIIYYWHASVFEFWLFAIYDKDEMSDLTEGERRLLAERLKNEIRARGDV